MPFIIFGFGKNIIFVEKLKKANMENTEPGNSELKRIKLEKTELEINNPSIDFGEDYENTKEEFFAFNRATDKLKSMVDDPDNYIKEYFYEIRNWVDLERELSKKKIDDHFNTIIEDLAKQEKECISKKTIQKHEKVIEQFENDLKRMHDDLNVPKFDLTKWNEIKFESIRKKLDVNSVSENYRIDLLMNQRISIWPIQDELEDILEEAVIQKIKVTFSSYEFENIF